MRTPSEREPVVSPSGCEQVGFAPISDLTPTHRYQPVHPGALRMLTGFTTRVAACASLLLALALLPACSSERSRLDALRMEAGAKGRAAAAASLVTAWRAKEVTLDRAITLAFELCDATGSGPDATGPAFAGAVLDAIAELDAELPHGQFNEFFSYRIGGLASRSASAAAATGDEAGARSLVLAGGTRWQTDMYWMRHPAHDALATYILYRSGEGDAALARLRNRPDLPAEVEQAKRDVEAMMRADRERARRLGG